MTYSLTNDELIGHSGPSDEVFYRYCPEGTGSMGCQSDFRCVGALPERGGQRSVSLCGGFTAASDSVRIIGTAARAPNGGLAWSTATRSPTASFSVSPEIRIQAPGDLTSRRLLTFEGRAGNPNLADRIWWLSAREIVTRAASGTRVLTLEPGGGVRSIDLGARIDAVDVARRRAIRRGSTDLTWTEIGSTASGTIELPIPDGWFSTRPIAVGAVDGVVVVIQSGTTVPGVPETAFSRVLLLDLDAGETRELQRVVGLPWSEISLAADGRAYVVQQRATFDQPDPGQVDLHRFEIAP
jgi:hypothetical protein